MQILYLDDSGKVHPNDPLEAVAFGGFTVPQHRWYALLRQVSGLKGRFEPNRKPHEWEIKSGDFLTPNKWLRAKKRNFLLRAGVHLEAQLLPSPCHHAGEGQGI